MIRMNLHRRAEVRLMTDKEPGGRRDGLILYHLGSDIGEGSGEVNSQSIWIRTENLEHAPAGYARCAMDEIAMNGQLRLRGETYRAVTWFDSRPMPAIST